MNSLVRCSNLFGPLSLDTRKRIMEYMTDPTVDRWDDIQTIIISARGFKTIWEAVIRIDPSFPRRGRAYDAHDNLIREWARIPDPLTIMRAIKAATE